MAKSFLSNLEGYVCKGEEIIPQCGVMLYPVRILVLFFSPELMKMLELQ